MPARRKRPLLPQATEPGGPRAARRTTRIRFLFLLALALAPAMAAAQAAPVASATSATSANDTAHATGWSVTRIATPIRVDGVLDESAWQEGEAVPLAFETDPGENSAAPVATTCRLLYDDERFYVGCHAEDPRPESIRARFTDRDQAYDGDYVGVRLDPFLDRRRAFEFYVNPLGVQMDLFRDDLTVRQGGGDNSEDTSWDAIWDGGSHHCRRLRRRARDPVHLPPLPDRKRDRTWGIGLLRVRPRRDRLQLSSEPFDRNRNCSVCQLSTVGGFEESRPAVTSSSIRH
ncbi:MAG: carbohydrate binding family 9 domain-containing protein [Thermoanaerobaculia bacterium]